MASQMPSLLEARRAHRTQLRVQGPSPQPHTPLGVSLGGTAARRVTYDSEGRELAALYHPPAAAAAPALLYLHGEWALADRHLRACQPFIDAGFAVLAPSYRGENGNPGAHEMLWGELDDALAALAQLGARPEVDARRVFVLGHSAGGMLAMLMSFARQLGAHLCGSIAGIYDDEVFDYQRLPFVDTPEERRLRLALPHVEQLLQPHIAFVGQHDLAVRSTREAGRRARASGVPLEVVQVAGDHDSSVAPAMRAFLDCVTQVL